MDLGVSDLERSSTDYVKYCELVYAYCSNNEGVVMRFELKTLKVLYILPALYLERNEEIFHDDINVCVSWFRWSFQLIIEL